MRRSTTRLTVVLALAGGVGSASAQTDVFWSNAGSGTWGNSANWSPAIVPNNADPDFYNATLGSVGVGYTVQLDLPVTIENFTISESLATLDVLNDTLTINLGWDASTGTVTSSLGGGLITVAGETVFGDVVMMGSGQVQANGSLKIAPATAMEICDTDVDYGGTGQAAQWEGNNAMLLNMTGSFTNAPESEVDVVPDGDKTVAGDGTGQFVNEGELTMLESVPPPLHAGLVKEILPDGLPSRGSARVNDTLRFDGSSFFNRGGVNVLRGELDLLEVVNDQTTNGVLQLGRWILREPATGGSSIVRFPTRDQVSTIDTEVSLFGENTFFPAIGGFEVIGANGVFSIGAGRDFNTQDGLTVLGEIVVGGSSVFDAQTGLNNLDANGTLTDGVYSISGTFLTPTFSPIFQLNQAQVRLIGPNAAFPAVDTLTTVGTESLFSVELGRVFTTQGNLFVTPGATLRVGQNSQLDVSGQLLNESQNILQFGAYEIGGVLRGGIGFIVELRQTRLALIGPGSQVLDFAGTDLLQFLQIIGSQSTLEVRAGRTLVTHDPLVVSGTLLVDPASGVNPPPPGSGGVSAAATAYRTTDELIIDTGSEVRIGVRTSGVDGTGLVIADAGVQFVGGSAGTLVVEFEPGLSLPDPFVRTVIQAPQTSGQFAAVQAVGLDPLLTMDVQDNGSGGLEIRVARACQADMNDDGVLDNGDIGSFVSLFLAGDLRADFNGDGLLDNGDIGAFVTAFLAGCP